MSTGAAVSEDHLREIERVMLYIAEARQRAAKSREALSKGGAEPFILAALEATEAAMQAEHRRLMQSTFFHVEDDREPQQAEHQRRMAM